MKKKSISIFGVTGSVGSSTLDLLRQRKDEFEVIAMTCNNNIDLLLELSKEFNPKAIAVADDNFYLELKKRADGSVECFGGSEGLMEISNFNSDIVIASIVGLAGLESMLSSIKNTSVIAIANKECIVAAGSLVVSQAKKHNCQIIPIDSEHNAIFQILDGKSIKDVEKIYLTASGGPFYKFSHSQLKKVTPAQAVKHPVWSMGKKISVDSATLMNKGLEIIEAHHLFGLDNDRIEVIVHRQSIIHGLALMKNGALLGYFGKPSMLNPIDHALAWPLCKDNNIDPITIEDLNNLTVESVSDDDYKSLFLSRFVIERGGFYPAYLSASNEIAVNAFLKNKIMFLDIVRIVEKVIDEIGHSGNKSLETMASLQEIIMADNEARIKASEIIKLGF